MKNLGGRPNKLSADKQRVVYEQRKLGKSNVLIAYTYDISVRTVDRICKKYKDQEAEKNEK